MADLFNKMNETRARIGAGSGVYTPYLQEDGKYALLAPLIKVPFIGAEVSEVEIRVASSNEVTKLGGIKTYNASEADVYMHRDCVRLFQQLDGKTIPVLFMAGDFSGQKCDCQISYSMSELEQENPWQGVVKFTPVTPPEPILNAFPLLKPTALITSNVDETVWFDADTATYSLPITTKYEDTTITPKAENEEIVTATFAEGKLTLTPKAVGSTLVVLKTAKAGYASWETTILVIVEAIKGA